MYITPNAHHFRSLSQLHSNWIHHLKPWLDANGPKIAESFQSSPVWEMPYIDVFLQQTLAFLVFSSGPVVSYCGTIIRKLAFRKRSYWPLKIDWQHQNLKVKLRQTNGIYANSPNTGLKLSYGCCYFKICMISSFVLPLFFSLNGGSVFVRLVSLKGNGNSICWAPPWRIVTSASWFHKPALEKKRNWYMMTLKQEKEVKKKHNFCRFTKSGRHCGNQKWAENSIWFRLCFIFFVQKKDLI